MTVNINAVFLGPDGDPRFLEDAHYVQCRWGDGDWAEGPLTCSSSSRA
ncbi:hypothetical protein ACQB60_19365 [Actinomycetota bacterium Odt1-20B]